MGQQAAIQIACDRLLVGHAQEVILHQALYVSNHN